MTILIATGLRREARLMAGPGVTVIAGGGDAARLERELEMLAGSAQAILSSGSPSCASIDTHRALTSAVGGSSSAP